MSGGYVIGCDLGSQSIKAVLMAPDGTILGTQGAQYDMVHPESGWAEQDPADYLRGLITVVRATLAAHQLKAWDVSHIGLASQVDGVVPLDASLRPLRSAMIWLDCRATAQTGRIATRMSTDAVFDRTGLNLDATHTAPKIMWIADNQPEIYRRAKWMPSVGAYALAWLTGTLAQDHANASSTLLYDVRTRAYSAEMADAAGIDLDLMPPILRSSEVAGNLTVDAAEQLGLTTRCAVVVGTGDEHAACFGAGGVTPDVVVDISGTAEPVCAASRVPVVDAGHLVETHGHAVDDLYLIENPGFVSGGNTLWLGVNMLRSSQAEVFELAAQSEPGARGVRFVPALSGAMAPRWNNRMRGGFYGLSMSSTAADMARAVIEANCFAFRDIYDRLGAMGLGGTTRIVGGGARSEFWLETKATITRSPIQKIASAETTAVGGAMLAALAAGHFTSVDECVSAVVQLDPKVVEPVPAMTDVLDEAYAEYQRLYDCLENTFAPGVAA